MNDFVAVKQMDFVGKVPHRQSVQAKREFFDQSAKKKLSEWENFELIFIMVPFMT